MTCNTSFLSFDNTNFDIRKNDDDVVKHHATTDKQRGFYSKSKSTVW